MRLAEHVAHTVDVDTMLMGMTPRQFDEWCAKDAIEPIGTRSVCDILSKLGQILSAANGHALSDIDFRPWAKQIETALTPAESAKAITAVIQAGVKRG